MDTDSESNSVMSFRDLEDRRKLFRRQFKYLLKSIPAIQDQSIVLEPTKELSNQKVEEVCQISKEQHEQQKLLVQQHEQCSEEIKRLDNRIDELETLFKQLKEDMNISKHLAKACKKYSTYLDVDVDTKDLEDENRFLASVHFSPKENDKCIKFIIDRKQRHVIDFQAGSIMSDDEANELKAKALKENGLNMTVILKTIRDLCI